MSAPDLTTVSTRELVELYNSAARKLKLREVNKFADRPTALKRTTALLEQVTTTDDAKHINVSLGKALKANVEVPPPTPAELVLTATKSRRARGFNFPVQEKIKKMRKGTLRAHIRDFLISSNGATYTEVVQCVKDFDRAQGVEPYSLETRPYEALRLLHLYCGYGLKEQDGKIYLIGE